MHTLIKIAGIGTVTVTYTPANTVYTLIIDSLCTLSVNDEVQGKFITRQSMLSGFRYIATETRQRDKINVQKGHNSIIETCIGLSTLSQRTTLSMPLISLILQHIAYTICYIHVRLIC